MKKSYLILVSVLVLSSLIYPQGKFSFQFSGGIVYPLSPSPGLTGTIQYNYNIADYSVRKVYPEVSNLVLIVKSNTGRSEFISKKNGKNIVETVLKSF